MEAEFDYLFKLLMIGDSGVGKSSLLLSFTSGTFDELSPTVGVDFKVKYATAGGKQLKLAIWDTVYDVTRRETFTNLKEVWSKEFDLYTTNKDCIKMVVGNKVDKESQRIVTKKEGLEFARDYGCLFIECSAKTHANIVDTPSLLAEGSKAKGARKNILSQKPPEPDDPANACC
ncbi:hypothetical protein V6N11_021004 [Hibiscus sabdariffa]|uniref:Uncharacterized protein n=2 Tax=Hibiscus sabdariffa TaxID=183260 RepID=A0ABR2B4T4_9ROSI